MSAAQGVLVALAAVVLVAGCASAPPPAPALAPVPLTSATPTQMVDAVRAAGATSDTELAVRPLTDPATADLRERAAGHHARGAHAEAAIALDAALALAPDDPALLQERAEAALFLRDFGLAETYARRAHALGSQVGPMCRRHWATVEQSRLAQADAPGAETARVRIAECRVDRPARY